MSKPDVTVEIGIFNGFQLDDPEFGVLDTGVLDGGVDYTEVPQGVVSVSTSRGRNRDIGKTSAGSLSVSLRNEDRFFDPLAGSSFADLVRPRLPIRVTADGGGPVASGGTVTDIELNGLTYRLHTFASSGTFTVDRAVACKYVAVAGGGGGGVNRGGGGGAGGVLFGEKVVGSGSTTVVVGSGGAGSSDADVKGASGQSSKFGVEEAFGGGGGASYSGFVDGVDGGSGGGASQNGTPGAGVSGQGFDGGSGDGITGASTRRSGGGGGAGGPGQDGITGTPSGSGGVGVDLQSVAGSALRVGGGGAGGIDARNVSGVGSAVDGGGSAAADGGAGGNGTNGTGGGGAGGGVTDDPVTTPDGGDGGSGLVLVAYPLSEHVFAGFVDDWDFTYTPGGQSSASVEATDGFSRFARNVNGGGSAPVEGSGARLNRVLDQLGVDWPAAERDIEDGQATLAAGVLEGEALGYLLDVVEQSELGLLFMSKSGDVAFRGRLLATQSDAVRFSDDGLGVPFSGVEIEFGSEDLVNQAIITGPSGTAVLNDSKSQILFGITAEEIDTQVSTLAQQEGIAEFLIQKYSVPELRVQGITVNMQGLSSAQQSDVLGLEIGDQVDLQFTPNKIPPSISVRSRIIGVSHDVGVSSHFVTFNLEKLPFQFFVLNSATFGKLDEADVVLGF